MEFEFTVDKKIFEKENFRIYRVFSNSDSVKHMLNPIYGNVSIKGQMPSLRSGIVYVGNIKSTQRNDYGYTIETSAVMPRDFNSNAVNTDKDMKEFIQFFVGSGTADKFTDITGLCKAVKEEDIEFLKKTKGIGDHTANKIINTFKKEAVDSKFLLEFKKWGFTDNEIKRLKRDYENNLMIAYEDIKKNIFKLVFKGYQLGRMDKIYLEQLDGVKDNPNRIKAYIVKNFENCLFEDFKSFILIDDFKRLPVVDNIVTSIGQEKFNKYLKELIREEKLYIINDKYISTHSIVTTDTNLYYELKRLIGKSNKLDVDYDIDEELKKEQEKYGVTLNEDQYNAVKSIIQNKVTLLTGGGGCGKTFCVRMAISLLERLEQPFDSTLVCLSGKASSVLQKSTHHEASTIHRALGFGGGEGFRFNSCNKFRTDLTLCDEVSMVSDSIMNSLLQAVSTNSRVVFVGDEHQLTAIGQSNPISDLSRLPLNKVKLTKPMRQATRSGILLLATDIRNDKNPFVNEEYHTYGELQDMKVIISENKYDEMINNFVKDFDVNNKTDYSLLACTKKLTSKINIDVQEGLIKCGKIKKSDKFIEIFTDIKEDNKRKKMKIYPGDVLLICKNNYKVLSQEEYDNGEEFGSLFLYNGQTVIVDDIYDDAIRVEMNGEYYIIHENFYDTLSSGYSFSIHRSQGETIPHCYIYLDNSYVTREMLLCNEMLYTAVSRAKSSCELYVEDYRLLTKAIRNREVNNRQTILELLIDGVIKPSLPDLSQ